MIATRAPSRGRVLFTPAGNAAAAGAISLLAAAAVVELHEVALWITAYVVLIGLTIWRPRYGIYAALLFSVPFDPASDDPFMYLGYLMQTPISAASPAKMLVFSPIELLLLMAALVVVITAVIERRALRPAQLQMPLLLFAVLMLASIGWGLLRHGLFNVALWETRSMFAGVIVALLVPTVMPRREQVHHLVNLLAAAVVLLSIDIIWRRFTILADVEALDLVFSHDTPIFMNIVIVLFLARLVWPATGRARCAALLIPLIIYAQMLTERRAGWVSLDVGLVLIAIFIFRLRRKVFYFIVLPLVLVYAGYLAAFWNGTGPAAQPARAVRSINDPEGRDFSSNLYRMAERANIRANMRAHPLTGLGFGQQYIFYYPMADLSWWPFWHYIAHTQLLWLWMKMGSLGFVTFLTLTGAGIVRGVQLLKREANQRSAPYLVTIVSALLMLVVYSYIDIALNSVRVMTLMGLALGAVGVWGHEVARSREES